MGTGFDQEIDGNIEGIIPRAVRHIFSGIETQQNQHTNRSEPNGEADVDDSNKSEVHVNGNVQFSVAAQFMELYNEEIIDLLDPFNKSKVYKIHEDAMGGICVSGATTQPILGPGDALRYEYKVCVCFFVCKSV